MCIVKPAAGNSALRHFTELLQQYLHVSTVTQLLDVVSRSLTCNIYRRIVDTHCDECTAMCPHATDAPFA